MSKEIIVIGAGAAGLMAARRLASAGRRVIVLEAGQAPGGRIHTLEADISGFSFPVESGAEFIHGELAHSLELAKEAGVALLPLRSSMVSLSKGESISQQGGSPFLSRQWDELMEAMDKLIEDVSMAQFMDTHFRGEAYAGLRESVKRFAEGYDLADLERVSAKALYAEWAREGDAEEYRPEGGYRRLIGFLVDEIRRLGGTILFSAPATRVRWQEGEVEVTIADGRVFTGGKVVIAVGLGVLQQDPMPIHFLPELPGHLYAARQLGYGSVIKILLEWTTSFWEEAGEKGKTLFIISEEAVPTWWTLTTDEPLLTGWLAGEKMRDFQKLSSAEQLESCLGSLGAIFSVPVDELRQKLKHYEIFDWASHSFVLGGYSYEVVEGGVWRERLAAPISDTLFFAGEALYTGIAPGTVEAALDSGWKAAEKIIAQP